MTGTAHRPTTAARIIAISSGKGGVGKTNVSTNLGIALARRGHRVCVFDADTGLANINILLNFTPEYTLEHLLSGERAIDDILVQRPEGIAVVPAASGLAECADLGPGQRERMLAALRALETHFDYILIDTAAGIGPGVLDFVRSAHYPILTVTAEPTALTDAYAMLRVLHRGGWRHPVYLLVNDVADLDQAREVFGRFHGTVDKYLGAEVHFCGFIAHDDLLPASVRLRQPLLTFAPRSPAANCFTILARHLDTRLGRETSAGLFSHYWERQWQETTKAQAVPSAASRLNGLVAQIGELLEAKAVDADSADRALRILLEQFQRWHTNTPRTVSDGLLNMLEQGQYDTTALTRLIEALQIARASIDGRDVEAANDASTPCLRELEAAISRQEETLRFTLSGLADKLREL